jgi:hypothetical protein
LVRGPAELSASGCDGQISDVPVKLR